MTKSKSTPAAKTAPPKARDRKPKPTPEAASAAGAGVVQPVAPKSPDQPKGKLGILLGLLTREQGATIFEMAEATGWQFHSVRGALAGSIKKKLGYEIRTEKPGNERIYRASKPADSVNGEAV